MKCAVVMPVGPGHELLALDARDSVARAFETGPGSMTACAVIEIDDTRGTLGRSAARNRGVIQAVEQGANWIFFLDADDVLHPGAFAAAAPYLRHCDAVWGAIWELAEDEESGVLRPNQVLEMSSLAHLLGNDPWATLQMGHFVKAEIALATPFNAEMNAGEDFDYYLRVWSRFKCVKIPAPLFYNRRGMHSTGARSATGSQWRAAVQRAISGTCIAHGFHADFSYRGENFRFFINNPFEIAQNHFLKGRFYGLAELEFLETRVAPGSHILEVGAHTGNHAVYFSRFMRPRIITVIEPRADRIALLRGNLVENRAVNADLSLLGAAGGELGSRHAEMPEDVDARSMSLDPWIEAPVDLIRIDVEGREMDILTGACKIISRWRPKIMVRVPERHRPAFSDWCRCNGYQAVREFPLGGGVNIIVEPIA